jgi:hypothetical protein
MLISVMPQKRRIKFLQVRLCMPLLETHRRFIEAEASRQTQQLETAQGGLAPWNDAVFLFFSLLLKRNEYKRIKAGNQWPLCSNTPPSKAGVVTPLMH